jgi:hypothetical protein
MPTVNVRIPAVIIHNTVPTLVSGASTWALMHSNSCWGHIFFLDLIKRAHTIVLRGGRGNYRGGIEGSLTSFASCLTSFGSSGHGGVEGSKVAHHSLVLVLLISVDGLGMLTQVIETRKLLCAVASKGAFASMFPERR